MRSQIPEARGYSSKRMLRRQGDILAAAREMLSQGDGEIRMRELAERSDVALGTLYNRFGSKEAIAAAAVLEVFHKHIVAWEDTIGANVAERLDHRVRSTAAEILLQPAFARTMVSLYFRAASAGQDNVVELLHAIPKRENVKAIEELQSAGVLLADVRIDMLAEEMVLAQYATIARWAQGSICDDELVPRLNRVIHNHLLAWLAPEFRTRWPA